MNANSKMKIVITGGHHSSALPVIKRLSDDYPGTKIYWFGHKFSALGDKNATLEFREITALEIPFYDIKAGKFYRTFNIKRLLKIPFGFFQCLYLLAKIKPDAIMSFGGYIAVPTVLAGKVWGIPSITHEQTAVAGWANRLISKYCQKILISWKESEKFFPTNKTAFVGLPLRKEIFESKSNNFIFENNLPIVYITTGKIGSHVINKTIGECLEGLLAFCNIIHQCGDNSVFNDYDMLRGKAKSMVSHLGVYYLRKFVLEDEIGEAYLKSRLVLSRAGAHTTAELLALNKSCVLIPIPWVSHNEQYENAKLLVKVGLGSILDEKNLTGQSLQKEITSRLESKILISDKSGYDSNLDSAGLIVKNLVSIVK